MLGLKLNHVSKRYMITKVVNRSDMKLLLKLYKKTTDISQVYDEL